MRSLVVIADKSSIVGQSRLATRYAPGVRVVATLDGRAPIGAEVAALEPDMILLSEMCQRVNTLARLREVRACCPRATLLLLVSGRDSGAVRDAFAAGAHAVLGQEVGAPALGNLIGAIALGQLVLSGDPPREDDADETPDGAPVATVEHLRLVRTQEARRTGRSA